MEDCARIIVVIEVKSTNKIEVCLRFQLAIIISVLELNYGRGVLFMVGCMVHNSSVQVQSRVMEFTVKII